LRIGLIWIKTVYLNTIIAAFPSHPINRRLHLGFHPTDQFAVGRNQRLLGFDLVDDGALGFD
jgi:hypothetical protein